MGTYTWQVQRSTDGTTWSNVTGASGSFSHTPPFSQEIDYVIQSADVGDYLRLKVTDPNGIIKYSTLVGPATNVPSASGCYFGARIDGAFYSTYYSSGSSIDPPFTGATVNQDLFERHAGKAVSALHWGGNPTGITSFNKTANANARARGQFSMYSMAPSHQQVLDLANNTNVNGTLNLVDTWATDVSGQNYPILLRPMWEMNGNWGYAWQTGSGTTSTQYKAAWQTLYNRINAIASCVSFFWVPNIALGPPDPTPWFPGTAYVDWVGMDGYNKGTNNSPTTMFGPTLSILQGLAPGKPVGISEVGCEAPVPYSGGKAQWITDFFSWLAGNPSVKLFSWFNETGSPVWPHIEVGNASSAFDLEAESAFKAGVANSRYLANLSGSFSTGQKVPIPGVTPPVGGGLLPSSGKTYFGSSASSSIHYSDVESSILNGSRALDIVHTYKRLDSYDSAAFPGNGDDGTSLQTQSDAGKILFFNFAFKIGGVPPGGSNTWLQLTAGAYDSHLIAIADKIKVWYATYGRKIFISWEAEMDRRIGVSGNSNAEFPPAWQHIHNLFVSRGARDACVFVFCPTGYMTRVPQWTALYPGDGYVDWLGYDPYGKVDPATGPPDATAHLSIGEDETDAGIDDTAIERFYKWANGMGAKDPSSGTTYTKPGSHAIPIMIAETGLSYNPTADAAYLAQYRTWWSDLATLFAGNRWPLIRAYVFFPNITSYDPRLDVGSGSVASPQAGSILANFRSLAALSRLNP